MFHVAYGFTTNSTVSKSMSRYAMHTDHRDHQELFAASLACVTLLVR